MEKTGQSVLEYIATVTPARRREDAETLLELYADVSGREPEMWSSSIVGFGSCHYRYPTGTEGDMPILAFAPRKASTTVYAFTDKHAEQLARLGDHTSSVSCIYIKDLSKIDLDVLREILADSLAWTLAGGDEYATITIED
ncbi:hypothetical protein GCM10009775_14890 [Microbacterium aoyamense]|uniref:YdhG-like domain-containing protein n=1 Tax=Microbacterium aoyamense TaxID=344166 RepID=A0ABP5AVH3_9MICO|nr:DUF1801 domain-containing protein [Microbacterium aoyamense]